MGMKSFGKSAVLWVMALFLSISSLDAQAGQAYRRISLPNPAVQDWYDGLTLSIDTDVEACKKAYGNRWFAECEAPAPGKAGMRVEGIRMTPAVKGVWRWISESRMQFTPEPHLAPDTTYTISLERVDLPSRFSLNRNVVYHTQPQAVRIARESLWIDPSAKARHVLSVPLHFIWPVNPANFEKNVSLRVPTNDPNLRLGETKFVWNEVHDYCVVNIPVLSLPAHTGAVTFTVKGMPSFSLDSGKRVVQRPAKGQKNLQASSSIPVTGVDRVMDVKNIVIEPIYDDSLARGYNLLVTTTMQVKPNDVLNNLDLLLLPKKASETASKDCNWEAMPALSPKDIEKSEKIRATLLQPGDEPATEIRLRLPVEAGRGVMCAMKTGLVSTSGFSLNRVRRFIRTVPTIDPEINFLQPGNVLTLHEGQKIDLHSVGLEKIVWEVSAVREPFLALAASKLNFDQSDDDDLSQLTTRNSGTITLSAGKPGEAQYTALDVAELLGSGQSELFALKVTGYAKGKECCKSFKLLLSSTLGMMLKTQSDGSHLVFVRRLSDGQAVSGAEVELLGANGVAVVKGETNSDGVCTLPSTWGLTREKEPSALVCRDGKNFGWLLLNGDGIQVSYDDFSVAGRHAAKNGLIASVFTERGVYMPGETLHFGAVIRNQDWKPLGESVPLTAILYAPNGNEVLKQSLEAGQDGFVTFDWKSSVDGQTGTYRLDVIAKGGDDEVLGSVSTRVEEFQPDTLAIALAYAGDKPKGWIPLQNKAAVRVDLSNLYGEKAQGNRIRARFRTEPRRLSFAGYSDFTFCDTEGAVQSKEIELPETVTDENGSVTFTLPLQSLGLGTQLGILEVEGFEKGGGRGVGRSFAHLFSPKQFVLGYKPENGVTNLQYIPEGTKGSLRLLLLNPNLEPSTMDNVKVVLSARRFVTSLVSDSTGHYRYEARPVDTELRSDTISLDPKGTPWLLPDSAGDYLATVQLADGTELGQIPFTIAGNRLAQPGTEPVFPNGSLRLVLDKDSYKGGETIHFQISAPFAGHALATIERDRVEAYTLFSVQPGESVHEIEVPNGFEGRGYLNISLVRDASSEAIYMNPHAYAVAPFSCGVEERDMGIAISAPEKVLAGDNLEIAVSAKHSGRVQLFVVDEGILQLTNFVLPDPLRDLLTERALDVVTREAYHLLMPDHERLLGRIPGFGGGIGQAGGRFLNPFRRKSEPPFVFWSPILEVGDTPVTCKVPVPSYFGGSFRVMAVGSSLEGETLRAGAKATKGLVRGNVIIKPELPLVSAPGDSFTGSVVLANTVEGSGANAKVSLTLSVPDGFTLVSGKKTQSVVVPENEERVVPFSVKVTDELGAQDFTFKADLNGKHSERSQSVSVRPLTPSRTTEKLVLLSSLPTEGDSALVKSERSLYPYEAQSVLTVSEGSLLGLRAVLDKLSVYPYGCTEQKISQAMPYAVLWDRPALRERVLMKAIPAAKRREQAEKTLSIAVEAIRSSLQYDGVALWPEAESDLFVTAYAGDFLVTMHEHGIAVPEDLFERVLSILEDQVGRTPQNVSDGRIKIYAAWVLQRSGRIMTAQLTNLEDWFAKNTSAWENDVLASLLAESFATLRLKKRAEARLPKGMVQTTNDSLFSTGMARALHALILEKSFDKGDLRAELFADLIDSALTPSATTVDLAMTSRALAEIASKKTNTVKGLSARCEEYATGFAEDEKVGTLDGLFFLEAPGCSRFAVAKPQDAAALSVLLSETGFDKVAPKAQANGIEITKSLLDKNGSVIRSAERGDVVTAKICARSHGDSIENAVLLDLVPGGLEPILEKENGEERPDGLIRYERREDRAIFFANLSPEERCFTYRLRAVTKGSFVVPGASVEAMYKPVLNGISGSSKIEVR